MNLFPFPRDFFTAKKSFLTAADEFNAQLISYPHVSSGREGLPREAKDILTTDVATLGCEKAKTVVVFTSGIHGVELFHGSALQRLWMRAAADIIRNNKSLKFVFAHAMNPIGSLLKRREAEGNVDQNRNFIADYATLEPTSEDFTRLAPFLEPVSLEATAIRSSMRELKACAQEMGGTRFLRALAEGQSTYPNALFYTGTKPTWGIKVWQSIADNLVLKESPENIVRVDTHSGQGPYGVMQILGSSRPSTYATDLIRAVSHESGLPAHFSNLPIRGDFIDYWPYSTNSNTRVAAMTLEVGTSNEDGWDTLRAMIKRSTLYLKYQDDHRKAEKIISQFEAAFCPRHDDWQQAVVRQGTSFFKSLTAHL